MRTCSMMVDMRHSVVSEGLQNGAALQVRGHNHCMLAQVEGEGVTQPSTHQLHNIEWYPAQEVLQSSANVHSMTL